MSDNKGGAVAEAVVRAEAGKYLTFNLDDEEFGLEILKVQEIIGIMKVTRVPRAPNYVRGVINLRGKVIPVVDLRLKFGMQSKPDTERTCIIVVQINRGGSRITMGSIVDDVSEVLNISKEQLEPAPSFGVSVDTEFILGMGKVAQKVVMLLDIDRVLSGAEAEALGKVAEQQAA
jgi:purine-binding chemotaxis protein CheW